MKTFSTLIAIVLLSFAPSSLLAETWQPTTGDASWGDPSNWLPASVPNAIGASATFDSPTATRTATLGDGNSYTVGSLNLTNNSSATSTIRNNSTNTRGAASLTFDETGSGPVVITVAGTGTNQYLITADMLFTDSVTVNTTLTPGNGSAGAISLTGDITGTGGLTKDGIGLMTMAFISGQTAGIKNYEGPTVINNGRFRHSLGGTPAMTSSVTVNNGGQIEIISGATIQYGASTSTPLNLNGFGPTSGPYAAFPGAIRPATGLLITLANNVVLQSDSMIHNQGPAAVMTLSSVVSGPGRFVAGGIPHDANVGTIAFDGANTYTGGTTVNVGALRANGASTNAFGTGSVQVVSANAAFGGSSARLQIIGGATDAIADTAYLNLAGGNAADVADDGYIELDSGVNETVGGLMLGGVIFGAGVYGSTASGAANPGLSNPDEFFAGLGTITNAAAGVPGDYNNNGAVDAADFVLWRSGGPLQNDFTPGVQASDYDFWRSRFGATTNPGSGLDNAALPEPTTFVIAMPFMSLLIAGRRQRLAAA